jgi:hypothetical protein
MHVDTSRRHHRAVDGTEREYRRHLLRRSYRDLQGCPQKETLANLSALPDEAIVALRAVLSGKALVEADSAFEVERCLPHRDVTAVCAMASQLGIKELLGADCRERDLAYALIVSRVVWPTSKLSTSRWWGDATLGADLGVVEASTDEVYAAMDWLGGRQDRIEAVLAKRHLAPGGMAMFDLSSSWVEGQCCELAAFGYSRDRKRGSKQVEYGLLTDRVGRPVGIRVFSGNTSDATSFIEVVRMVRDKFGLERITMVGDRGMITSARIAELRELPGMEWITALRRRSRRWPPMTGRCRCRCSTPRTSPRSFIPIIRGNGLSVAGIPHWRRSAHGNAKRCWLLPRRNSTRSPAGCRPGSCPGKTPSVSRSVRSSTSTRWVNTSHSISATPSSVSVATKGRSKPSPRWMESM